MTTTQVNVNLNWFQRRKLPHHPYVGHSVDVRVNGDMDAWKWRRDVYLTGPAADIAIVLIYINHKEVDYQLLRPRTKVMPLPVVALVVVLTIGGGEAMASYEYDSFSYNRAMTRDTPASQYSLGPQSWCCGKIPSGAGPRSAPSSFYNAVKSAFGSMYNAVSALNARLNRTSNFDPTYGATNYNSNLGGMDPNSFGSGVTAW